MKHSRIHAGFYCIGAILCVAFAFSSHNVVSAASETNLVKPDLRFSHLGLAEGLSHADVRRVARDYQGFMWFGTWLDGLNRYDGYTFKVYRHDSKDERSLAFDNVYVLCEDHHHSLWVGTYGGGLDRYDRDTDNFVHYHHRAGDTNSLIEDTIAALYEDESGELWIGARGGVSRFNRVTDTFQNFNFNFTDSTKAGDLVRSICRDRKTGLLWMGTSPAGVKVLDPSTGKFMQFTNTPNDPSSVSDNRVNHVYQDRSGNLWFCTDLGLNRWNPDTKNFVHFRFDPNNPASLADNFVSAAYEDHLGRFWIGTANGLDLFDRSRETFFHYRHDPNAPASLSGNEINVGGIYEDDTGALWVATHDSGVNRLDGTPAKFVTYRNKPLDSNSLNQDTVTALFCDHAGNLWIGTGDGLNRFDGKNFTRYSGDLTKTNSITPGPVWAITESPDHQLWVGVNGGGLCRFDGTNFTRYRHDPADPRSLANDYMYGLQPDRHGGLWISVHGCGLDYFDGREFIHFQPDAADPDSLPERYVGSLFVDENNCAWMGSAAMGLIQFDPATRKATAYLLDPARPHNKVGNWVRDINSDGKTIWVASYSGLYCFDLATKKFTHCFTERDGMGSSSVLSVQHDARGNVWVTTLAGLSRIDVEHQSFRNYVVGDGLQSAHFCERSRTRMSDGRICFGGASGFNIFDPENLPDNPIAPPVVLTEFQLFNKPVPVGKDSPLQKAIHVADRITLRYDQEVFRLRFAALNFTAPERNFYAYRLEGFDDEWRQTDAKDRSATYTKLNPGTYTFRVKASNNDGVWNETGASVAIIITPPWWQTGWFRSVALASILALAYGAYALRIQSIKKHNRRLEQQVAERTTELTAKSRELGIANKELESFSYSVSHDLRAPLRSIDGFSKALLEDYEDKLDGEGKENLRTIRAVTRRMGTLIDDILRLSKINRCEMHWSRVDLSEMAEEIVKEFKEAEPQRTVEFLVQPGCLVDGDAPLLRIALENILSNAWKYTGKKPAARIELGSSRGADGEIFFVRDDGCGFEMKYANKLFGAFQRLHSAGEFPGTGIGLASVQRVIQRHGGRVWIESELNRGTTLYFTLTAQL